MINLNKKYSPLNFLVIISLLANLSCDFQPELSAEIYSGKELIITQNTTGMKGQILVVKSLNNIWLFANSKKLDTINSKRYTEFIQGELVEIYTLPDTVNLRLAPKPKNTLFKIIKWEPSEEFQGYEGLIIEGDLSNGISKRNIRQTPSDIAIVKYKDSLEKFSEQIKTIKQNKFNYQEYLTINKKIDDYIETEFDNVMSSLANVSYLVLAAQNDFLSQEDVSKNFFWGAERIPKYFLYTVRKLPFLGVNQKLSQDLLSQKYKDNSFFKKGNSGSLKVIINEPYNKNEIDELNKIKQGLNKRFKDTLNILTIPVFSDFIDPEKLFGAERYNVLLNGNSRNTTGYLNFLHVAILDKNNKVLLNTTADEHLDSQIEGILEYLEKQDVVEN